MDAREEEEQERRRAARGNRDPAGRVDWDNDDEDSEDDDDDEEEEDDDDDDDEHTELEMEFDERGVALLAEAAWLEQERSPPLCYRLASSYLPKSVMSWVDAAMLGVDGGGDGRGGSSDGAPRRPLLAEAAEDLARRYGGDGAVLWRRVHSPDDPRCLFQVCYGGLSHQELANLLWRLLSDHPHLLSRQESDGGCFGRTLLHVAVARQAPLEVIRLLVGLNPDALLLPDDWGYLPIHEACDRERYPVLDLARVRALAGGDGGDGGAGRDALKARNNSGETPLHLAAEHLMTGGLADLQTIWWLIDAHPEAIAVSNGEGQTPLIAAIESAVPGAAPTRQALGMLLGMLLRSPESVRGDRVGGDNALHKACERCPRVELVSPLVAACPSLASDRNSAGKLPLHLACSELFESAATLHVQAVIQLLIDKFPEGLEASDNEGNTPIMTALSSALWGIGPSPTVLPLLLGMIGKGGPRSLWVAHRSQGSDHRDGPDAVVVKTAVEVACGHGWGLELLSPLVEAHPSALCVSLLRGDMCQLELDPPGAKVIRSVKHLPAKVADFVTSAAREVFLAATEVLLHEKTRGVVPDAIRAHVRNAVGRPVPPGDLNDGGGLAAVHAVPAHIRGQALGQLRSEVLSDGALQAFLRSSQDFQDLISGVHRMNKAGRLEGPPGGGAAVEQHARILAAAGDNVSCLFLHLRESPALFGARAADAASSRV